MDTQQFQHSLFNLIANKLHLKSLSPELQTNAIRLYNSIDPIVFKNQRFSDVINPLSTAISKKLMQTYPNSIKSLRLSASSPSNTPIHPSSPSNTPIQPSSPSNTPIQPSTSSFNLVKKMLSRQTKQERQQIILDLAKMENLSISHNINTKIATPLTFVENTTDTKELLKKIIGSSSTNRNDQYMSAHLNSSDPIDITPNSHNIQINQFLGINDISTLQLLFNPSSLYVHYYVVLDTDYRILGDDPPSGITKFKWNYSSTKNTQSGFANSVGEIRDVISMRLYQPKIHYLAAMNTTAKRVSLLVEEFSAQSFIGENGRRFHYTLRPNFSNTGGQTYIELTMEDNNDTVYHFRKPFTTIDTFTLSFGDPLELLTFPLVFNRFFIALEFTCFRSDR